MTKIGTKCVFKPILYMSLIALYVVFNDVINIFLNAQGKQSFDLPICDSNIEHESIPVITYESQTTVVRVI